MLKKIIILQINYFREIENNEQLLKVMQDQEKSRQDLVVRLREDEQLQKALVAALLERSDARSWSIVQQVNLVQSQLAALTTIELERRKYEINQHIVSNTIEKSCTTIHHKNNVFNRMM